MKRDFNLWLSAFVIGLVTVTVVVFASINFTKEKSSPVPYDGVWWVESTAGNGSIALVAKRVEAGQPGDQAGIKNGDQLVAVGGVKIHSMAGLMRQLYRGGIYSKLVYSVTRHGIALDASVIPGEANKSLNDGLRLIALIYLMIGLYVLLRRWTAPKSTHFFLFCLVSFVFYSFKYTGKLNQFDEVIYWGNVVAWLLQPALFLHFVLTFPEIKDFVRRWRWVVPSVYLPAVALLILQTAALRFSAASELLRW